MGLINKTDIRSATKKDIAVSDKMTAAINLYSQYYSGRPPYLLKDQVSLNLPISISSELARLTTIEMKSEITGSSRADFLNDYYKSVIKNIRHYVEYGCGKGGFVLKPYPINDGVHVDIVQGDCFFPTSFDSSGAVTGAIFPEQITRGKVIYTRLEEHDYDNGQYTITNKAYRSTNDMSLGAEIQLSMVDQWADIQPQIIFAGIEKPLFAYFRYPLANNIDSSSPFGVACFARALDLIRDADDQWNRVRWEFKASELAIDASIDMLKPDPNHPGVFDLPKGKERLFRKLDSEDHNFYEVFSPDIRDSSLFNGLNKILQRIEFNCCLAYGTLSDPVEVEKTAEEIRSSKQRSYAMVCDIQKALKQTLEDLVYAMDAWTTLYRLCPAGQYDVSFDFDDSIISDKQREFTERQQLVASQASMPWELRVWYFGETEEQAKAALSQLSSADIISSMSQKNMSAEAQTTEVAGKSLNGAQTQSLIAIMAQFSSKQISEGQAINLISTAIGISKEEAKNILQGVI